RSCASFRALYLKAGLPDAAFKAFRVALQAMHETGFAGDAIGASALKRRMIERVLTQYEGMADGEVDFLFAMLRRLAAEAARDDGCSWIATEASPAISAQPSCTSAARNFSTRIASCSAISMPVAPPASRTFSRTTARIASTLRSTMASGIRC